MIESLQTPTLDILMMLKKIRLNDLFVILAIHFGMSESNVSRIFKKSLIQMAQMLQELIIWLLKDQIRLRLPIPFRARYANVVAIIDCLEIQVEKPSDPVYQALSWSQYKSCNTLKYLISCTPEGLVNIVAMVDAQQTSVLLKTVVFWINYLLE